MQYAKYVTEFLGTFFLMFTIAMVSGPFAPFAIAAVLTAFVYAGGHISSGHYNPAVTLGAWIRGALPQFHVIPYVVSQIIGALVAVLLYWFLINTAVMTPSLFLPMHIFIAEFLFTFALVFVVLNTATVQATTPNSYFGLAIGLTVLVGAFVVGSLSSAVFNPAIAVALVFMKKLSLSQLAIYLASQCAGGVAAAYVFRLVNVHAVKR